MLFSPSEIKALLAWDQIAQYFRLHYKHYRKKKLSIKDIAFREVYGELIRKIIQSNLPHAPTVLKTDLWNEGVESGRNLATFVNSTTSEATLVGIDISKTVCEYAKNERNTDIEIVRSTLLASPFQKKFDFVIDVSTIDHIPENLRERWIQAESSLLKENGIILISFDCKFNIFCELFHRFFTRRIYPEWTLRPACVRIQLENCGFQIIREHALFILGLFFGMHRPWFPLGRFLKHKRFIDIIKTIELSRYSRLLSFLAPQYVFVAIKRVRK